MATKEQRARLLSVSCPWCGVAPGETCVLRARRMRDHEGAERKRRPPGITTLDGGCHDARWQKALGQPAPVLTAAVAQVQGREAPAERQAPVEAPSRGLAVQEVAAALGRPW